MDLRENKLLRCTINIEIFIRDMAVLDTPEEMWNIQKEGRGTHAEGGMPINLPIDCLENSAKENETSDIKGQVLTLIPVKRGEDTEMDHLARILQMIRQFFGTKKKASMLLTVHVVQEKHVVVKTTI